MAYGNKDRHLWARGYYVTTVGNVNEETIRKRCSDAFRANTP
ncbi:MAG: transposase [Eubacterium sp.]|nr:transposase [Eubacterium sp.]